MLRTLHTRTAQITAQCAPPLSVLQCFNPLSFSESLPLRSGEDDGARRGWRLGHKEQLLELWHPLLEVLDELLEQSLAPLLEVPLQSHLEPVVVQLHRLKDDPNQLLTRSSNQRLHVAFFNQPLGVRSLYKLK